MYHNILADNSVDGKAYGKPGLPLSCFKQQLKWLLRHRQIVSVSEYLEITRRGKSDGRKVVALTFDDGLASTFERVYPLLEKWRAAATFFISTSHLKAGVLLWFSYLNALCFDEVYDKVKTREHTFDLSFPKGRRLAWLGLNRLALASTNPKAFGDELAAAYPLPDHVASEYRGMSLEQMALVGDSDLVEPGAHTVNHPFLHLLSMVEQEEEIVRSKKQIEELTGRRVRYFAYPNGDYNRSTLSILDQLGFEAAFATHTKRLGISDCFEIPRQGIYSSSFLKFWLKAEGVVTAVRELSGHLVSGKRTVTAST